MKLFSNEITYTEVPNLICRSFSISNCGGNCPNCHSPWLKDDLGEEFTDKMLMNFISMDDGEVDCYVFLGDGQEPKRMIELLKICKENNLKTCLYVGKNTTKWKYLRYLDYIKLGSYIEDLGGLNCKTTNQVMYKIENITNQFQK